MAMKKSTKITVTAVSSVIVVFALVYAFGCFYFSSHFFPNTMIGQNDISMQSTEDFAAELAQKTQSYVLNVEGEGFSMQVHKDEAGIALDENKVAVDACMHQDYWGWPIELFQTHDASDVVTAIYDVDALTKLVTDAVNAYNETAEASADAQLAYNADFNTFIVVEEVYGKQIDATKLLSKIEESIKSLEETCTVTPDDLLVPKVTSADERFPAALMKANQMLGGDIVLTLDGSAEAATVHPKRIAQWITMDSELVPRLDMELVQAWVNELSASLNTVGTERTYQRADGKVVTVSGGSYGWSVDTENLADELAEHIGNADFSSIDIPVSQSAYAFNGKGSRDWGAYVDVDISEQKARYYDASDNLVYECDVVTGMPVEGRRTPTGVYYINHKQSPSVLLGLKPDGTKDYETKVTFWMPFIGNSVGFHDATWQGGFGGNRYTYSGSHGCVNLSYKDAEWFYDNMSEGLVVITHD